MMQSRGYASFKNKLEGSAIVKNIIDECQSNFEGNQHSFFSLYAA